MPPDLDGETSSMERYHQLLDSAPDAMIVVDDGGYMTFVNQQAERLFGYPRAELLGMSLSLLVPERFRAMHAIQHQRYRVAPTVRAMGSGLELFGRRKDGTELCIEVSLSPTTTAAGTTTSATIRDVTERRRILDRAELSAQRLASAVESIQDAFALFDANDALVECNSVYRKLLGDAMPGPLIGRRYEDIVTAFARLALGDDEERAAFVAERLVDRTDPKGSYDVQTRDGRRLRVSNRRTPEGGIVKTVWDLTRDLRREEELHQARLAAEAGSAAKSEFLSSMSHELRTPMNAILGFAQLLQGDKKEPLSPRHLARVEQILKGGEHLLHLIDDVLDLSRIEGGNLVMSLEAVPVGAVLLEVSATLGPLAARHGIELDLVTTDPKSLVVLADRTRFAQILLNFGSNAVKYNRPQGRVSFGVTLETAGRIRVAVRDSGFGVPLDKQDRLFELFQRAGQEKGPIEGTGIGLAISKRLAGMMNGAVGFESDPARGSTFWVELPTYRPTTGAAPAPSRSAPEGPRARRLVVHIEDNPANIAFLEDVLSIFEDLDVLAVPTAELGIELARARQPAVVILDVDLPRGHQALETLRLLPETRELPVIALTASTFNLGELEKAVAAHLRRVARPAAGR